VSSKEGLTPTKIKEVIKKMRTYRDVMKPGENLTWCKPEEFTANGKKVVLAINEGNIVGVQLDGKDSDNYDLSAVAHYLGVTDIDSLSDLYYAEGVDSYTLGCSDCPWFDICDAMSEKFGDD